MTVICVKAGVMAADSHNFCGGSHWPSAFPKISRGPGGLIGIAGDTNDCWLVHQWWQAGAADDLPMLRKDRESIAALILKHDGSVWCMDERLKPFPMIAAGSLEPATTGEPNAATFCEGAMHAGLSAQSAVQLAIQHCQYAAGEVLVETIDPIQSVPSRIHEADRTVTHIGSTWSVLTPRWLPKKTDT